MKHNTNWGKLLTSFFQNKSFDDLWKEYSLWRAMYYNGGELISHEDVLNLLSNYSTVFVLPNPFPALRLGIEPVYKAIHTQEIISNYPHRMKNYFSSNTLLDIRILYLVAPDFSWLLTLNSPFFEPKCLLKRRDSTMSNIDMPNCIAASFNPNYYISDLAISTVIKKFYQNRSIAELWKQSPSSMLWECPWGDNVAFEVISQIALIEKLQSVKDVFIFSEPLEALYLGLEPRSIRIPCCDLLKNYDHWLRNPALRGNSLLEIEPLYILDPEYNWLLIITTENTNTGGTICFLLQVKTD